MRTPTLRPLNPRFLAGTALLLSTLLPTAARAGDSVPGPPEIVHDPEAAAELAVAFEKLWELPSFRQSWRDLEPEAGPPRVTEFQAGGVMRMTEPEEVGEWDGTAETIFLPGRAAYRFVSPTLDAYLAQLKARQRAATLVSVGMALRSILQDLATGGPLGALSAAESGLSLLGSGRGAGDLADADLYGKWQCVDLPDLPIPGRPTPGGAGQPAPMEGQLVERLPATTIDGAPVRAYRSVTDSGGAVLAYRNYVLEETGLPRRSELEIDMPGFRSRSVLDFYDHGEAIAVEIPDCAKGAVDQGTQPGETG